MIMLLFSDLFFSVTCQCQYCLCLLVYVRSRRVFELSVDKSKR